MSNMIINTNVLALNSHRSLKGVGGDIAKASEKLSSGQRINRAADDAAGLAISEKMRSQIRGLDQASRNSQDGISLIQTAEGALQESQNMLQRMRELTVQASNDTTTASDREKIALEMDELVGEIDGTAEKTEFNTKKLIDGSWKDSEIYLQTGANKEQGLKFNIEQMNAVSLGVTKGSTTSIIRGGVDANELDIVGTASTGAITDMTTDDAKKLIGTYKFSDTESMSINADGSVTVAGMKDQTTGNVVNKTYSASEAADMVFEATNGGTATFDTGTLELEEGADAAATVTFGAAVGDVAKTTFGTITAAAAGASDTGDTYAFKAGVKLTDANGAEIKLEQGTSYTGTDLAAKGVANIYDDKGNRYAFDATSGELTAPESTKAITFNAGSKEAAEAVDGMAAVGQADGKTISKITDTIDKALEAVSSQRAKLGAYQNRLEHTIKNLDTSSENLSASESRVRDTDMAKEMMNMTKKNVLSQAATSMLAQANQAPQNVLKLLG